MISATGVVANYLVHIVGIEFTTKEIQEDLEKRGHRFKSSLVSSAICSLVKRGFVRCVSCSKKASGYLENTYIALDTVANHKASERPEKHIRGRSRRLLKPLKGIRKQLRTICFTSEFTMEDVAELLNTDGEYSRRDLSMALVSMAAKGEYEVVGLRRSRLNGRQINVYKSH